MIQTYISYGIVVLSVVFELAALITDAVFISRSSISCDDTVVQMSLATWGFVNSFVGAAFGLVFVWWFAAKICDCEDEETRLVCFSNDGAESRKRQNICFWIVFSVPTTFRLAWCVVGIVLSTSLRPSCAFYADLFPLVVAQLIVAIIGLPAMIKTACNKEMQVN